MISIRINSEHKEICKKLNISYAKIWKAGFENLIPKKKKELKNLAQNYKDLYIHYNNLYIQFDEENKQNNAKIDEFCKEFNKTRDPNNYDKKDEFWINAKIEDNKLNIDKETFLNRCKELISNDLS